MKHKTSAIKTSCRRCYTLLTLILKFIFHFLEINRSDCDYYFGFTVHFLSSIWKKKLARIHSSLYKVMHRFLMTFECSDYHTWAQFYHNYNWDFFAKIFQNAIISQLKNSNVSDLSHVSAFDCDNVTVFPLSENSIDITLMFLVTVHVLGYFLINVHPAARIQVRKYVNFNLHLMCVNTVWVSVMSHPEGTSKVSCKCDFSKVSDFNGSLWNINVFPP